MQDDRPRRRGNRRRGGGDETAGKPPRGRQDDRSGPGTDSGFFTRDGFEAELDAVAFENTALNNMDPIREAQLFEQFEQDYRSGGYDPGPELDAEQTRERFGPDPRDISGYRPMPTSTDSGYHAATDSGYREPEQPPNGRPRHGKSRDRRRAAERAARQPMFARRDKPAQPPARRPRSAPASQSPFGDLTPYLVPILAAVVVVMVIVVLLLNR